MRLSELLDSAGGQVQIASPLGQWLVEVSRMLDDPDPDVRMPAIRRGDPTDAAHYPTVVEGGPSAGYAFANDNWCYIESPLRPSRDRSKPLVIGIGWVPTGNDPLNIVRWEAIFGFEYVGKDVTVTDLTKSVDSDAGGAALYKHSSIIVTPAEIAPFPAADEVHMRLQRLTTGNDPATPPALHHIVVVQPLL